MQKQTTDPASLLEEKLLAGLQEKVLLPEVVEYTIRRFEDALMSEAPHQCHEADRLRHRKATFEAEIRNLTEAIANGENLRPIMDGIARQEGELAEVSEKLARMQPETVKLRISEVRKFVESRLRSLRILLNADPLRVRAEIAKHVQRITLTPDGKTCAAPGTWDLLGCGGMDGAGEGIAPNAPD